MKTINLVVSIVMLSLFPALSGMANAAPMWWPKSGDKVRYDLFVDGARVGRSDVSFAYDENGKLGVVQNQQIETDFAGMRAKFRATFRENWLGQDFETMSTFGLISTPAGKVRLKVLAELDGHNKQVVKSKLGERQSDDIRVPATFWHLNHLTYPNVFDPYAGGFAALEYRNLGAQVLEIDDGKVSCLAFELTLTYIDHEQFVKTPLGPDPEDIPLKRTYKGWFEPSGLMCALSFETPVGVFLLARQKTNLN